jgi:hypothetical protein
MCYMTPDLPTPDVPLSGIGWLSVAHYKLRSGSRTNVFLVDSYRVRVRFV